MDATSCEWGARLNIRASIDIRADLCTVFDVFRDLTAIAEHVKGISEIELLQGPGSMAIGTRWRETRTVLGRQAAVTMWVTELDEPRGYTVAAASRGTTYRARYTFTALEHDRATRVELVFSARAVTMSARLASVIGFLFAGTTRKLLQADMADLKAAIEAAQLGDGLGDRADPGRG